MHAKTVQTLNHIGWIFLFFELEITKCLPLTHERDGRTGLLNLLPLLVTQEKVDNSYLKRHMIRLHTLLTQGIQKLGTDFHLHILIRNNFH
jgi:hypothetical protein